MQFMTQAKIKLVQFCQQQDKSKIQKFNVDLQF